MRKLLSSTVLGGAIAFTALVGMQHATAGTFHDLTPNSEWAISKIESNNASGKPYCALARRFTNDVVLTFARNQSDETSIAIDFQKPRMNKDQYYSMKLDAGYGEVREFSMKPVSEAAVVLKIGSDQKFLRALERSTVLKADIEGYEYAFNISNFTDGQMEIGGCLADLVAPAAGGFDEPIIGGQGTRAQSSPLLPVASESERLAADPVDTGYVGKISNAEAEMARDIADLKDENMRLRSALEKERRQFENKFMEQSNDSSAMIELSEKVQLLEVENNELRHKVTDMAVMQAKNGAVASDVVQKVTAAQCEPKVVQDTAMVRELQMLRDENAKLQQDLKFAEERITRAQSDVATAGSVDKQMAEGLNGRISSLEQENRLLKLQLSTAAQAKALSDEDSAMVATMQSKINDLQIDNARLQATIEQQNIKAARFDTQDDKSAVINGLQQRVDSLMAENSRLVTTIDGIGSTSADTAPTSPFLVSKIGMLETQLEDVKRERNALLSRVDAMNKGREGELINISSDNWNLEQATRRFNEAEREIQRLGLQLEQERSACNAQKREIEYMLFDPKIATKQQIARLNAAEEKALKAETLLGAQKAGYETTISSLKQDVSSLEAELSALRSQMKVANAALADSKAQETQVSAAEIERFQREKEYLVKKTAELEKDNVRLSQAIRLNEQKVADITAAERMNVIEAAAGGSAVAGDKIIREPLATPMKDVGPISISPKAVNPYVDTLAAQSLEEAAKAKLGMPQANGNMTGVDKYLDMAGIEVENGINKTKEEARFVAYSWEAKGLYGSADQRMMGGTSYDDMIRSYLAETKSRCEGDFAASLATDEVLSGVRVSSYEIACIGNDVSAAASIVFIEEHGQFTAIAHEAELDYMDYAMDMRDKLIASFAETKMASR